MSEVEQIVLDLLQLVLGYVSQEKASELLMQAARQVADEAEKVRFPNG